MLSNHNLLVSYQLLAFEEIERESHGLQQQTFNMIEIITDMDSLDSCESFTPTYIAENFILQHQIFIATVCKFVQSKISSLIDHGKNN